VNKNFYRSLPNILFTANVVWWKSIVQWFLI